MGGQKAKHTHKHTQTIVRHKGGTQEALGKGKYSKNYKTQKTTDTLLYLHTYEFK